jgi:hypothetical protein
MPCNLAVTITKAVVAPEHLLALLTPEVIGQLITAFTSQSPEFQQYQPIRITTYGDTVNVILGRLDRRFLITHNQVTSNFPRYEQTQADTLAQLLSNLLSRGADRLFAAQVRKALTEKYGDVKQTSETVSNQGQPQRVTLFSFEA